MYYYNIIYTYCIYVRMKLHVPCMWDFKQSRAGYTNKEQRTTKTTLGVGNLKSREAGEGD